jgi:hypothetical protein
MCMCMCRDRQGEHAALCIMVMMGERSVWMYMVMSVCVRGHDVRRVSSSASNHKTLWPSG